MMKRFCWTYAPPLGIHIIHADEALIVVNKQSGVLSVPGREYSDSIYSRVQQLFGNVFIVHRLDMDTSGVMLLARTKDAERFLHKQFREKLVEKVYYARVWGNLTHGESGRIDLPIICDWPNRPKQKVCHETGKSSQTRFECIGTRNFASTVRLIPETGRTHQLRIHMDQLGHPILGDDLYGTPESFGASSSLQLHAANIKFTHPELQQKVQYEVKCPWDA